MKPCPKCEQHNPDDAQFCGQCGTPFPSVESSPLMTDDELWRAFIGPNADRYLEQFKKFAFTGSPRFNLTWNWMAFLFTFLWFLYRKMYLYAFVYAVGPSVSFLMTGDVAVGIVWQTMAAISANYIFYWHVKDELAEIKQRPWPSRGLQERAIKEAGGVQPYVIWVGAALVALSLAALVESYKDGSLEKGKILPARPKHSSAQNV